uniref:Uncharacterized protein n=1 Tax=viral metagenome TaxID=1070528 RepID=A0A6C0C4Y5_9ZZZZ
MSFDSGDFVVYYQNDIPIHALVVQKWTSFNYNKYTPDAYIISPVEGIFKYIRIKGDDLKLVKLNTDQKLMILTSLGKNWFCNNRKLFKKALQK